VVRLEGKEVKVKIRLSTQEGKGEDYRHGSWRRLGKEKDSPDAGSGRRVTIEKGTRITTESAPGNQKTSSFERIKKERTQALND